MVRTLELKYISELSLTVERVARGTNVITETIVLTEKTVAKTVYTGVLTGADAGEFDLAIKVGSNYVATDELDLLATDGFTYPARSMLSPSNSNAANKIADHVIRRKLSTARVSSDGDAINDHRSILGAAAKLVNFIDAASTPGTLKIFGEDDTTLFWSQILVTNAAAEPIVSANPV